MSPTTSNERSDSGGGVRQQERHQHQSNHVMDDMIAGFGAGFLAVSLGFPLDVIKTRLQTSYQTSQKEGKSVFKTGRSIVRKEGFLGLYKGIASPLMTLSVSSSLLFTSYGAFRDHVFQGEQGWHAGNFWAGMACGPIIGSISTVENHIRTQMQIDNVQAKRFRNSLHCISSIVRHHGIPTLFRGWDITIFRDCAYLSSYFFVYEGIKGTLLTHDQQQDSSITSAQQPSLPPAAAIPLAGGAAGTIAWVIAYPYDCVRAGLQGQCLKRTTTSIGTPHATSLEVLRNLLRSRGIQGLFMGVTPTLLRAPFVHGCRFSAYEGFLWLFRTLRSSDDHCRPSTHAAAAPVFLKTR